MQLFFPTVIVCPFLPLNDLDTSGTLLRKNMFFLFFFEINVVFIEPWLSVYRLKNRMLLVPIDCSPPQMGNKNTVISKKYMFLSRSRLDKNDIF